MKQLKTLSERRNFINSIFGGTTQRVIKHIIQASESYTFQIYSSYGIIKSDFTSYAFINGSLKDSILFPEIIKGNNKLFPKDHILYFDHSLNSYINLGDLLFGAISIEDRRCDISEKAYIISVIYPILHYYYGYSEDNLGDALKEKTKVYYLGRRNIYKKHFTSVVKHFKSEITDDPSEADVFVIGDLVLDKEIKNSNLTTSVLSIILNNDTDNNFYSYLAYLRSLQPNRDIFLSLDSKSFDFLDSYTSVYSDVSKFKRRTYEVTTRSVMKTKKLIFENDINNYYLNNLSGRSYNVSDESKILQVMESKKSGDIDGVVTMTLLLRFISNKVISQYLQYSLYIYYKSFLNGFDYGDPNYKKLLVEFKRLVPSHLSHLLDARSVNYNRNIYLHDSEIVYSSKSNKERDGNKRLGLLTPPYQSNKSTLGYVMSSSFLSPNNTWSGGSRAASNYFSILPGYLDIPRKDRADIYNHNYNLVESRLRLSDEKLNSYRLDTILNPLTSPTLSDLNSVIPEIYESSELPTSSNPHVSRCKTTWYTNSTSKFCHVENVNKINLIDLPKIGICHFSGKQKYLKNKVLDVSVYYSDVKSLVNNPSIKYIKSSDGSKKFKITTELQKVASKLGIKKSKTFDRISYNIISVDGISIDNMVINISTTRVYTRQGSDGVRLALNNEICSIVNDNPTEDSYTGLYNEGWLSSKISPVTKTLIEDFKSSNGINFSELPDDINKGEYRSSTDYTFTFNYAIGKPLTDFGISEKLNIVDILNSDIMDEFNKFLIESYMRSNLNDMMTLEDFKLLEPELLT